MNLLSQHTIINQAGESWLLGTLPQQLQELPKWITLSSQIYII